jgi:hypothetical protein
MLHNVVFPAPFGPSKANTGVVSETTKLQKTGLTCIR